MVGDEARKSLTDLDPGLLRSKRRFKIVVLIVAGNALLAKRWSAAVGDDDFVNELLLGIMVDLVGALVNLNA